MQEPHREEYRDIIPYKSNDKLGGIWRTALSLGKKMAVMGVAITSAPLVIPSFLALSALGVAFSVPAGIAFVTYACTEKVVNTLVPVPTRRDDEADWAYGDDVVERYGDYQFVKGKERESGVGNDEVGDYGEESVCYDEQTLNSDVITHIVEGIREAKDEISRKKMEGDGLSVDSLQAVVVAADVGGKNEDSVEEIENVAILESEGGQAPSVSDISENKGRGTPAQESREVMDESKSEANTGTVGTAGAKQKSGKKKSKKGKSGLKEEPPKPVIDGKTQGGHTTHDIQQAASSDKKRETLNLFSSDERRSAHVDHGANTTPVQISDVVGKRHEGEEPSSKNANINVKQHQASAKSRKPVYKQQKSALNQDATSSSDKISVDDEKIWEQINAMRTIAGYEAVRNPSYVEELEALYVFTGVKPPATSKGVDLKTINEKLHFLMSVIGVNPSSS